MKLYVIGNGFDLAHKLPTKYENFYEFAQESLDEIGIYYSSPENLDTPWHDFENALSTFDWDQFYDDYNHIDVFSEQFRTSSVYAFTDEIIEESDNHVEAIRNLFQDWVSTIDVSVATEKLHLVKNARFINFNYTSTLQTVYRIRDRDILHIHGIAERYDELIFGHGETLEEEPEIDEYGNSNRTLFSDAEAAAKYPFYGLKKPVHEVLEKHNFFFNNLTDISEIYIIGHSLNKVDLPYFQKLNEQAPNAAWTIFLYDPKEENNHVQILEGCGISRKKISTRKYSDIEI